MEKMINYENLRNFAYSNDKLIKGRIRGIVIAFYGLGGMKMHNTDTGEGLDYAQENILYVIPYANPWNWMNRGAVAYADEIISVLREQYGLGEDVKVVSTGGSMGGLCALVYCAYAKITPVACVANCPVCDLVYHYTERPDLPRTLYSAFFEYDGTMEEALRSCSPIHLVDQLPDIPYTVFHCEGDDRVNCEQHSQRLVEAMEGKRRIQLVRVPWRRHCDLSPAARVAYERAVLHAFN